MSKSESVIRKNVSWRVSQHSSSAKLNEWCSAQSNIQESISNLVLHMIEHFGYRDVTDYDIQKALFNGFNKTLDSETTSNSYNFEEGLAAEEKDNNPELNTPEEKNRKKNNVEKAEETNEPDDIYSGLTGDDL